MTADEARLRQLAGQHLLAGADSVTLARELCGVQAQFFTHALHALRIRGGEVTDRERAALVKSWTVRGTMHVFALEDMPLFLHRDRRHALRPCDTLEGDEYISRQRKSYFAGLILEAVAAGTNTRQALRALCAGQGMTDEEARSVFDPWGGAVRALCEQGRLAYEAREEKTFRLCPPFEPMERQAARREMARRYFTHYGPATVQDAAYFFGAAQAEVKSWLDALPVRSAQAEGQTYFWLEGGPEPAGDMPACLLLAGFDPLMLGYEKRRSLFLAPERVRDIFSLAGIVYPAVLLRGRVAGRWKRTGGRLTVTAFGKLPARDKKALERTADRLWPGLKAVEYLQ